MKNFDKLVKAMKDNKFDIIEELLKSNPELAKETDAAGLTALHYVNSIKACELLIDAGADVNAQSKMNLLTPLHLAASGKDLGVMLTLISKGAKVNEMDNSGRSALHWAIAKNSQPVMVEELIKNGANVNLPSGKSANTPLHYAAKEGNAPALKILLQNGADLNIRNAMNETPAQICKNAQVGKIINDHNRDQDAKKYANIFETKTKTSRSK